MPECSNCGEFVTEQYVRVFGPTGLDTVRVCPHCENLVRKGAEVREAKSPRHS
jgi:NAD-dependent SIR2 family protein deacetylase